ncbi:maleylpyruvate isomerase family mycothiol-dependent enzyme [Hoyosella rhizosphaerae]|uniref:Mycothiol-dependent maleylpyruvate isomerase metal-binding domain-containing protein n=1 Tax=Hoyosella rhizosphaerae TaxID=1755582 RepID=A0A916XAA6_9ACTN|nr:maleylpyruvate isomerase family mycothiol-dependent enzyme [Hoyosella rhizosphaerae]MBN4926704.1 maleylpyruvate isomerase family mycothiol-dependent enzyme [Hoyosella rhizosphaerae]GGC57077.1 hypothetical protein GCM10011410_07020 [Hoyosella rhizosphaerae]
MPRELERADTVSFLIEQWGTLGQLLDTLTDDEWAAESVLPGWSVHDIVSHVVGTELLLLGSDLPTVDFDVRELEYVRNDLAGINERWVQHFRDKSPTEMRMLFAETMDRRAEALKAMTIEEWYAPTIGPAGPTEYGKFMLMRLFDCWVHELDIRDSVDKPGDESGPRAEAAFGTIVNSLGYIVGRRAHAPEGSVVEFDFTGPIEFTTYVGVQEKARVLDKAPEEKPTTIVRISSSLFVRLACGRVDPEQVWDDVELLRDQGLGAAIIRNLNYVP